MIKDKTVLVTGGSRGIGKAVVECMLKEGAKVAFTGRHADAGEETLAEMKKISNDVIFIEADVANEADVQRTIAETVDHFGRLDGAFNNAGIGEASGFLADCSNDEFTRMFDINVRGVFLSMKYELQQFLKQGGGGSIVNCSSIQGHITIAGSGHYPATKHAVEGYTKMAALEYADQQIRVNAVAPAVVAVGRLGAQAIPDDWQENM
ncbi:MAG: SDR family NAD(P)-dependent oxidoreductase, partial [Alphaproteobacteria bacterium]|nr:SDR family NAD(P)-dependent oxidoreductase [Alphaproteobacteria bacterium]